MIISENVIDEITSEIHNEVIESETVVDVTINVSGSRKEITFDHTDTAELSKVIGSMPALLSIHKVRVDILEAFDAGIFFTIGDDVAQGRIMTAAQINAQLVNSYIAEPDIAYAVATNAKIYFGGGESTAGSGKIIIYYS